MADDQAPKTVEDLLAEARALVSRVTPNEAAAALEQGARLIDIRSELQRSRDGTIPGAHFVPRNVFEWRCDPSSPWKDPELGDLSNRLIVMCNEGYQSSLAAATLRAFGFESPGDVIGGFQAWRAAGLPVVT